MARRLLSLPVDDEAGPRIGGSGTEVRIYDDEALSVLSTLYADPTLGTTVPNPIIPNAGFQSDLTVATAAIDTVITVRDVSGYAIGNLVPIYDGSVTKYRVITAINAGTKQLTFATAVGAIFLVGPTLVGNPDMVGHIHCWLEDVRDYYLQTKDVASTRVLPPVAIPVRVPAASIAFQEEGVSTGVVRSILNFIGAAVTASDNAGALRVDVTVSAPTQAAFDDHSARHDSGGADVLAADAAAGTPSLRSLGTTATTAAAGDHVVPAATVAAAGHMVAVDKRRLVWQDLGDKTGAFTIDLSLGHGVKFRATGAVSITLTNPDNHSDIFIECEQDGTGGRTVTWTTTVKWKDGAVPVATTGASKKDIFLLHRDAADYLGVATLNF